MRDVSMTARDAFAEAVRQARRFRYIPDPDAADPITRLLNDEWDTVAEFERRGGGDCDGHAIWTTQQGHAAAELGAPTTEPIGEWCVVVGLVRINRVWRGHAWSILVLPDVTLWADPTWGVPPAEPAALGYPDSRRPQHRWTHVGHGHLDQQQDYEEVS